jgi:hypothetical protein
VRVSVAIFYTFAAYSVSGSPAPPDRADNLVDAATSTAHGVLWEEEDVSQLVGGDVPRRLWTLQTAAGDTIFESGDSGSATTPRRPYDYFMAVFPVVEREHGKTEPGGGHRQSTARALPRGRLPALGSSGWTRVPFTQRRLEAAVYLSKESQAGMGENPEREEKAPKLHLTRRFPLSPNHPENHDLLRSDTKDRPSPSTLEPSRLAVSRRSGNPGRLPHFPPISWRAWSNSPTASW